MNSEPTPLEADNQPSTLYDELKEIALANDKVDIKAFAGSMRELAVKLPKHHTEDVDYHNPANTRAAIFGECAVPIAELLASREVVEELSDLDTQSKEGIASGERVQWVRQNREKADSKDSVYLTRGQDAEGEFYWILGGGRHRLAADIIEGKTTISADVVSMGRFLQDEAGRNELNRLQQMQNHSEKLDKQRQNLNNGQNIII